MIHASFTRSRRCGPFCTALMMNGPTGCTFLSTELETLGIITFCLCHAGKAGSGLARVSPAALWAFLMAHFDALNRLFAAFSLDEDVNEQIWSV